MKRQHIAVYLMLGISAACSQTTALAAVDRPGLLGTSNPSPRTTPIVHSLQPAAGSAVLSAEALQLATSMDISSKLERIQSLRAASSTSTDYVGLKEDTLETIVMAGYEVDTVTARIDRELANASEILAYLAERRDRAVRINSYADFISGGITGIVGGGLNLGKVPGPASDLLDTIEGGIQTSLATWALKQQGSDAKHERGIPSILAHLFGPKKNAQEDYPPAVWSYLSDPLPATKNGACRLDLLVSRWQQLGYCFTHRGHANDKHAQLVTAAPQQRVRLTISILEDRIAMLNDLRATVLQMNSDLLELTQALHGARGITKPKS